MAARENLPHATVATVIESNGKFLMVKEISDSKVVYNQPAGHIESGESITAAAIRETFEETGWKVKLTGCLGLSVYHAANGISYIRTTLIAEPELHDPEATLDTGILAAEWLTYEQICSPAITLRSPVVRRVIDDYRQGICYPLALISEPG